MPVHSTHVVTTAEAAVDAKAGLGLTRLLSYQIDAMRRAGELNVVLEGFEPPPIPVSLVFNAQQRIPLKLRAFLDFAAPRLHERLLALAVTPRSSGTDQAHRTIFPRGERIFSG